jgi:4-phospho-D-threonate 3-dehydrogenase / 4-phospho-D-erythronate 3-dehydrogenase
LLGKEEIAAITPAVKLAQAQGFRVQGPFPADFLWPQVKSGLFDIGVAMYHDQGQIPLKLLSTDFSKVSGARIGGVNVTVGVPIIRTSVAHGTAYDIAGKGVASPQSLIEAVQIARQMIKIRFKGCDQHALQKI